MVTAVTITQQILLAGETVQGPTIASLAGAIGDGVAAWVAGGGVQLTGVSAGAAGVGTILGTYYIIPTALPIIDGFTSIQVVGVNAGRLAAAIGIGLCTALNLEATYVGTSSGVGSGVDSVQVVTASVPALAIALSAAFEGHGIVGVTASQVKFGLANGIAAMVSQGRGTGIVSAPSTAPVPVTAPSISRLV